MFSYVYVYIYVFVCICVCICICIYIYIKDLQLPLLIFPIECQVVTTSDCNGNPLRCNAWAIPWRCMAMYI